MSDGEVKLVCSHGNYVLSNCCRTVPDSGAGSLDTKRGASGLWLATLATLANKRNEELKSLNTFSADYTNTEVCPGLT